ncbi:MAG: hypothetical protein KTR16_16950 [Acidiferrobacterales bacterium]|nr:hypothetical protein [Acidiferrobacterales bacterium]
MQNFIITCFLCISLSACASHYGAAHITSNPPGAQVINLDDGTTLGVTPATVWWKEPNADNQHIALRFKKDGYYEKVDSFWLSMRHSSIEEATQNSTHVEVNLQPKGQ